MAARGACQPRREPRNEIEVPVCFGSTSWLQGRPLTASQLLPEKLSATYTRNGKGQE